MTHSNGWDQWQSGMLPGAHPTRNSRQNFVFFSMIHVAGTAMTKKTIFFECNIYSTHAAEKDLTDFFII